MIRTICDRCAEEITDGSCHVDGYVPSEAIPDEVVGKVKDGEKLILEKTNYAIDRLNMKRELCYVCYRKVLEAVNQVMYGEEDDD